MYLLRNRVGVRLKVARSASGIHIWNNAQVPGNGRPPRTDLIVDSDIRWTSEAYGLVASSFQHDCVPEPAFR